MRIEEYIQSLPSDIISGESVTIPNHTIKDILDFADAKAGERFCHLGCGRGEALQMAHSKYSMKVCGVESNFEKVKDARQNLDDTVDIICNDIRYCDIPTADLILFWFADPAIIHAMMPRFEEMHPCTRIVTIWNPLPGCLPDKVQFPYIMCHIPFRRASDIRAQLRAVFGVRCISYATAWEYAERYTRAIQPSNSQNDRFLTILQALSIWCTARSMGITCETEIPAPVHTYVGIMRNSFGIDFEHLL